MLGTDKDLRQLAGDAHQEHHQTCMARQWARGAIPACAGKPPLTIITASEEPVYARVCGEAQQQTVSVLLRWLVTS